MQFPFLAIFLGIGIFLAIRYKSLNKKQDEVTQSFWEREAAANAAPTANLIILNILPFLWINFHWVSSKDPKRFVLKISGEIYLKRFLKSDRQD